MFDMSGNVNSRLGSPGMEYLITEEQDANKKIKKNVIIVIFPVQVKNQIIDLGYL